MTAEEACEAIHGLAYGLPTLPFPVSTELQRSAPDNGRRIPAPGRPGWLGSGRSNKERRMTISQQIKPEHIVMAMDELGPDAAFWPKQRLSKCHDVVHPDPGKRWRMPPKLVISVAARFAGGAELSPRDFDASEARTRLQRLGFQVIDRRKP